MNIRYIVFVLLLLTATCCEIGLNCMFVGKQMLEVSDTRQLTLRADGTVTEALVSPNGKYVAYISEKLGVTECRLAKISTGKTVTIMSQTPMDYVQSASNERWSLGDQPATAWSPDSSMFAFQATHRTWESSNQTKQQCILVYSATGAFKKSLQIGLPSNEGSTSGMAFKLLFTPDSRKILATLLIPDTTPSLSPSKDHYYNPINSTVQLIDIGTGASRKIYEQKASTALVWQRPPTIIGWSEDGGLLFTAWNKGLGEIHKVALEGSSDEVIIANSKLDEAWSPDGSFAVLDNRGLSIRNRQIDKTTMLVDSTDISFTAWVPNCRMILYSKIESIADAAKLRKPDFQSLWLSSIEPSKFNALCVALDADGIPSASRDCRKIAYVSQGQLYIAELTLREPTVREKLAAGIELTEEEMKQTLLNNGKNIGIGIKLYSDDYDGKLPPADSVEKAIYNNLRYPDVFFRPGTEDGIFKYIDPGVEQLSDIKNESDTVIGELDAGYGWKVLIYADSHVETKAKE